VLAHEDTDTNHYVNYLNECSGSKNLNTYTLLEEQTKIFSGDKLNEVCLQNKFKEHHQSHPIKINGKEDGFLKVNTIEFYYENDVALITSLYNQICVEACKIYQDKILIKEDKFWYVYDTFNNFGYEANFLIINPDMVHIKLFMANHTRNFIFNTLNETFTNLGGGNINFQKDYYIDGGTGFLACEDGDGLCGRFWWSAKKSYSGEIIELIDNTGDYTACYSSERFKGNLEIYNMMITNNKKEFCVSR
tara:strand:+ start:4268 stop:5011 length:744 start_codon:yes stop_codon:yes gene_type:complete